MLAKSVVQITSSSICGSAAGPELRQLILNIPFVTKISDASTLIMGCSKFTPLRLEILIRPVLATPNIGLMNR